MKTIVFTAQAFGFGPVSKMLAISESVKNARKVFFGYGVAYDLAKLHDFDEIHNLGSEDREKILSLLRTADLFVNVMEFPLSNLARIAGCPYFIIDILLWFWPSLPEGVRYADTYFCPDFFGTVKEKITEYNLTNAKFIAPLIPKNFTKSKKIDQGVICFSGMECEWITVGKNTNYPFIMLEILLPILTQYFSQILVVGRERVMNMCREMFRETDQVKFKMLDHKNMLSELYRSQALFTAPGSEIVFDAYDKLPIFFLPPQNNSNFRNLSLYIRHEVTKHYLHWSDVFDFDLPTQCAGDENEVKKILEVIKKFETNENGHGMLRDRVQVFLGVRDAWPKIIKQQKKVVERFGINGMETILTAIDDALKHSKTLSLGGKRL